MAKDALVRRLFDLESQSGGEFMARIMRPDLRERRPGSPITRASFAGLIR
jgi:hypothetical protein